MIIMAFQITGQTTVCSTDSSYKQQRKNSILIQYKEYILPE